MNEHQTAPAGGNEAACLERLVGLRRQRTNRRNSAGVKWASDCYRTIKGHEYQAWMSCPSADRIAAYRKAGVRVRRFGDELFVHVFDTEGAGKVDALLDSPNIGHEPRGGE